MEAAATRPINKDIILAVDDQALILEVLNRILNNDQQQVITAMNGDEALEILATTRPNLILLDVIMPGIDGFELCRRLKADPATRDIPVIFSTALTERKDKIKGFQLGAVDYITKPFFKEEVQARVKVHLQLRRQELALREALQEIKTLSGILPICSHCKQIRNDEGYWEQVEKYISTHSNARFSHGICPDCYRKELEKAEKFISDTINSAKPAPPDDKSK